MQPLEYPQLPRTQGQLKQWIDSVPFFRTLVSRHLENKQILETTSLDFITREWCEKNKIPYPLDFIDSLKARLDQAYETNSKNLPISKQKVDRFIEASKSIIEGAIEKYKSINNSGDLGVEIEKWYVSGQRMIQSKDPFSENPEADHLNFDTILGSFTKEEIHEGIASTFMFKTAKAFVLKPEDIFRTIEILGTEGYIIIGFGVDLNQYKSELKVPALTDNHYRGIEIVLLDGSRIIDPSFFIVNKKDLPEITTLPIEEATLKKYSLQKISESLNLYASLIDLNKASEELLLELKNEKSEDELKKSVLLTIGLNLQIKWRKEMRLIQLNEYSEYRQSGLPNTIAEVKSFVN